MNRNPIPTAGPVIASRFDAARFLLFHILPNYLQGLFTRNRFWVYVFQTLHPDPLSVRFLSGLRRKYDDRCVLIRFGRTSTLLLFDVDAVSHVLRQSPMAFAEPAAKLRGMSRFQPNAVTISQGRAWEIRRAFNDSVLASATPHPLAPNFAEIVREEIARFQLLLPATLRWSHFEDLFERIMLGVIFGRSARNDRYLIRTLKKLMRNGNRAAIRPPDQLLLSEFQAALRGYIQFPEPGSLVSLCAAGSADAAVRVEGQIPHWMFAMGETLAINCVRALALLGNDSSVRTKVREEIAATAANSSSADQPKNRPLLTGVLQEAMRLWPTTQLLTRRTLAADTVCDHPIDRGTQIMIVNGWFHRAPASCATGDEFTPEFWLTHDSDPRFNHFSNGTQGCAGRDLALFLGTEILAGIVSSTGFSVIRPRLNMKKLPHSFNHYRFCFRGEKLQDGEAA